MDLDLLVSYDESELVPEPEEDDGDLCRRFDFFDRFLSRSLSGEELDERRRLMPLDDLDLLLSESFPFSVAFSFSFSLSFSGVFSLSELSSESLSLLLGLLLVSASGVRLLSWERR